MEDDNQRRGQVSPVNDQPADKPAKEERRLDEGDPGKHCVISCGDEMCLIKIKRLKHWEKVHVSIMKGRRNSWKIRVGRTSGTPATPGKGPRTVKCTYWARAAGRPHD